MDASDVRLTLPDTRTHVVNHDYKQLCIGVTILLIGHVQIELGPCCGEFVTSYSAFNREARHWLVLLLEYMNLEGGGAFAARGLWEARLT